MKNTNKTSLVLLEADFLQFYQAESSSSVKFSYPTQSVSDIEVVDQNLLANSLRDFITLKKIIPGHLLLVLAESTTFVKKMMSANQEPLRQDFLDSIPFEHVVSKFYENKNGNFLLATNKNFFLEFQTIFSQLGFTVDSVIPEAALSKDYLEASDFSRLRDFNLLDYSGHELKIKKIARKQFAANKNLQTLLLVFSFALLILGGSIIYSGIKYSRPSKPVTEITPTPTLPAIPIDNPAALPIKILFSRGHDKIV